MASRRYTVSEAAVALFDDEFGLSEADSSENESGDDLYAYLGEPVLQHSEVDALTYDLTDPDRTSTETPCNRSADERDPDVSSSETESDMSESEYSNVESESDFESRGGSGQARGRGRACTRGRGRGRSRGRAVEGRCATSRGRGRGRGRKRGGQRSATNCQGEGPSSEATKWQRAEPTSVYFPYTKTAGPTSQLDSSLSPSQLFFRYFTNDVWELLVQETNRYAHDNLSDAPHARPWENVTIPEMQAFVGLLIMMGILQLPRIEMYWQVMHPILATNGISSIMSRIRFEQLYRFLHLANSNSQVPPGEPGHDKLFKVRPFLDLILPTFESEYIPHQAVTIDEAMIPFKGRLGFKQYIKNKPTKWGIKVFVLSDATNGYILRAQIYTGKHAESDASVGLCTRVVLDLMTGLEDYGLDLYTDNYYTGPELYDTLYSKGINACGTVRVNRRDFPQALVHKSTRNVPRGFYDYRSNGPVLAAVWFDKRFVYFLSTLHCAESSSPTLVDRRNQDGSVTAVECPPLLPDYQQYMRGVDRGDQLIGFYNVGRRSRKWWKRIFSYIIECCLLNAYMLEKHARPLEHALRGHKKRDFLRFRIEVAEELIGSFRSRKRAGRRRSSEMDRLKIELGHWPLQVSEKRECVACNIKRMKQHLSRSQLRHETRFKCAHCDVHLCIDKERNCFQKYHTLVCYWN